MQSKSLTCVALVFGLMAVVQQQLAAQTSQRLKSDSTPTFEAAPSFEAYVQPFLTRNCVLCHNAKMKTASVDFSPSQTVADADQNPELWEKALQKLRQGEMPPQGMPRPKQDEINVVMQWMEGSISRADANAKPDPGRVTAHRLNRTEYDNTVRDLLGVDIHPSDEFPQDDSGYGFDNIGDVLSISPVLMERYMNAAEKLVNTASYGPEKLKPVLVRHQPITREFPLLMTTKTDYDLTGLSMPNALHTTHRFPVDGDYTIRVALEGRRPGGSEPGRIGVFMDGRQVQTLTIDAKTDVSGSVDLFGMQQEFKLRVPAGDHWVAASILKIYEGLPLSYHGPNPSSRPEPPAPTVAKFMKAPPNATPEQLAAARKKAEEKVAKLRVPANRVYVHYLEIVGPYNQKTGPFVESRKLIFVCGSEQNHSAACARAIVGHFARRAFRHPVTPSDIKPYFDLYAQACHGGASFEDSIGTALEAVLVSPDFLFRIETTEAKTEDHIPLLRPVSYGTSPATDVEPLSEYALASRLSYFLWSTMPDDELMRCADRHTLHRPEVLKAQVERMLRDPRSRSLADNFAGQWLELRKLESVAPDHDRFPQWDDYLRMSMQQETELFFEDMVRQNKSILDFLDSKTTFVNQKLAEF